MVKKRIIPGLLLSGGRLVKGVRFKDHRDAGNPRTTALAHNAQLADELLVLDIHASRENRAPDFSSIAEVASECFMPLTVGGGVRSVEIARECMGAGADKVCVNTTALERPELLTELATVFGSQSVVLRIDVVRRDGAYLLYDHRSERALPERGLFDWMREGVSRGAGEVSVMAVDREGTRQGFDLDLLSRVMEATEVPVLLEGGAGTLEHLSEAFLSGADSLVLGTMLVFSDNNIVKIKRYLSSHGHPVRV